MISKKYFISKDLADSRSLAYMTTFGSVEHHEVIIIGAGIAGLKASQELALHNIDYLLLEARNRYGGRIWTKDGYDMGASWAHDTLSNDLFNLCLENKLVKDKQEESANGVQKYGLYYDDLKPMMFSAKYDSATFSKNKVEQVVKEVEKFIELKYFEEIGKEDISLAAIIDEYFEQPNAIMLNEFQKKYVPQLMRGLELWHGIGWKEMSSKFGLVDNVGRNCLFTNGYQLVVEDIMGCLDADRVKLNSEVCYIDRSSSPIRIRLANGDEHSCDYLICTCPQSVLQSAMIEWKPKFPARVQTALDNMSWGKLGKIVFEFEAPWWCNLDEDRFMAISDDSDECEWGYPVLILNYYKSKQIPSLLCFTQGDLTEKVESDPGCAWEVMKPVLARLAQLSGGELAAPTRTLVTDWTVDKYSQGSYAACRPGDDPTDLVIQLQQGLDRVRFAGEHTILDGAGAVHGAWMSGLREAEWCLVDMGKIQQFSKEW